jgi:thiamine-phosphate pyrophosphorylase
MQPILTPGAERVSRMAARIAAQMQAGQVEPQHLLRALLLDESRAAEILEGHSVSHAILDSHWAPLAPYSVDATGGGEHEPSVPESDTLKMVLFEARRQVALVGKHAEVGTEHLLCGLATIESPVRQVLHAHGLGPAEAARQTAERFGHSAEPLPAEIRLSLGAPAARDETDLWRILDAASNRAREGLRVLEDFARFSLDDRHLTGWLKAWRHRLAAACDRLDAAGMARGRDTFADVGTTVHTPREATRDSLMHVVRANCKRVQEAARTLEEYGKVVNPEFAREAGELRYASYSIEKTLLTTIDSQRRLAGCRLCLLVTQKLCPGGAGPVIRAALAAGVGMIQVREKSLPDRELADWGRRVREWTAAAGALYIMNDRPDLAVATDADGVHLGQDELAVRDARRIVGPHRLIGVSTHTLDQARGAVLDGADYLGIGPVFHSETKQFRDLAGPEFVRDVMTEITLPAFAIGGISVETIDQVVSAGATRIAVSRALCASPDPAAATRDLLARLPP